MKKLLLTIVAGVVALGAVAQSYQKDDSYKTIKMKYVKEIVSDMPQQGNLPVNISRSDKALPLADEERVIGHTFYDLQSNADVANRFWHYTDGTIGATWTGGVEDPDAYPDRGSFYNYFNGTDWTIPEDEVARIEATRRGWPTYCGDGSTGEYMISHGTGLNLYHRATKGEGAWELVSEPIASADDSWPRMCVNPETGTLHVLNAQQITVGDEYHNSIHYSRSKDGGKTWDKQSVTFDELSDYTISAYSADEYVWATPKAGVIAFAIYSNVADLIIMKSEDDGETWDKMVVYEHPYPGHNEYTSPAWTDTVVGPNGAGSLVIDQDGICHTFFSVCGWCWMDPGDGLGMYYFPAWGNLVYWDEDMDTYTGPRGMDMSETFEVYSQEMLREKPLCRGFDFNGDGMTTIGSGIEAMSNYRTSGPIFFVSAEMAGPNRIICAISTYDDRRQSPTTTGKTNNQIFTMSYLLNEDDYVWSIDTNWVVDENMAGYYAGWTDGNGAYIPYSYAGWYRVNDGYINDGFECIMPQVVTQYSEYEEANFYIFYNKDDEVGLYLDGYEGQQSTPTDNSVVMWANNRRFTGAQFPEDLSLNFVGIKDVENQEVEVNVYPNPASDKVNIEVAGKANVKVYNLLGQMVDTFETFGKSTLNVAAYQSGVYFIKVDNGNASSTHKLIVR